MCATGFLEFGSSWSTNDYCMLYVFCCGALDIRIFHIFGWEVRYVYRFYIIYYVCVFCLLPEKIGSAISDAM